MNLFRTALSGLLLLVALPFFAQTKVKSPDEFLPHKLGEKFTAHHQLTAYFDYLAANAQQTMRIEQYGTTNEDRPLRMVFVSSPENIARLEQIRVNNLRLAGSLPGQPDVSNPIAIVWISMSVHGNEPSGSECSMELAYRLAMQTDPQIKEWLKNTVVIIDPSLNPDGYDRYTHWNRDVSNSIKNTNPDSREHREPWPGGRVNHYYFDLNRDWAWATQVETRQRILAYQRWLPQVHADLHEQGVDNPYYFAPAAEPTHDYITPWQREFQTRIGENHARYFDQHGWMYFTKEVFDLFYPSYGDTYPMLNGAIGMTYEQGGNSSAGTAINMSNGDTLTLHDRILHHLTTSLSTIEITSRNAAKVVENFRSYYAKTSTQPQGIYKAFVIRDINDPNKINTLCTLLDLHQIKYGRAGAGMSGVKAFDYQSGKETTVSIQPNDVVISAYQLKSTLLQALFDPESRLSDSLTYDITAWALPYAHGLSAYALKERLEPKKPFEPMKAPTVMLAASPYSWCIHRNSIAEAEFLSEILQKGVKVRYATKPFSAADQQFVAGALVINRGDNRSITADLDGIVKTAAARANVTLHPIFTGYVGKGSDLGSETFQLIKTPEVAIVYGEDVENNEYGQVWYFFEQDLKYPITPISLDRLHKVDFHKINTLIFPNGSYHLTEPQLAQLLDWVRKGGRIIASEGALKIFADKDGFALKTKEAPKKDSVSAPLPFYARERAGVSDQIPGAIMKAKADPSHPLAYGMGDAYFTLKTNSDVYEMPDKATAVIYLE
ncbi:MAG: M14 family zinc carboxypeptidase, partial [Bacteroidota bacterium]